MAGGPPRTRKCRPGDDAVVAVAAEGEPGSVEGDLLRERGQHA